MTTIQITENNFAETIKNNIVLIDFWAAWCGPCRAFAPIFEAASTRHPDVVFGKVDTDAEGALAATFKIQSIPTIAVFREGILLHMQPGMLPAAALETLLTKVRALDMNEVRKSIASKPPPAHP